MTVIFSNFLQYWSLNPITKKIFWSTNSYFWFLASTQSAKSLHSNFAVRVGWFSFRVFLWIPRSILLFEDPHFRVPVIAMFTTTWTPVTNESQRKNGDRKKDISLESQTSWSKSISSIKKQNFVTIKYGQTLTPFHS